MRKVALVIGNGRYEAANVSTLDAPANDAKQIGAVLKTLGWTGAEPKIDCNTDHLKQHFRDFIAALQDKRADVALIYFSGHGLEFKGKNYAVPIDFDPDQFDPNQPRDQWKLVSIQRLVDAITTHSAMRIVILDACRDDPKTSAALDNKTASKDIVLSDGARVTLQVSPNLGLAEMKAADNTFLAFAAGPGEKAGAGDGVLSPFTEAILHHLDSVDLPIWSVTARVRQEVMRMTDKQQIPWNNESLLHPFFFNPGSLLFFMGTAMALLSLLMSVVPCSLLLIAYGSQAHNVGPMALMLSAALPIVSLAVLLFGMQSAYSRVRGDYVPSKDRRDMSRSEQVWDHCLTALQKGVLGGYLGSFFCAYLMSISYHNHWAEVDRTTPGDFDPLAPLGMVMLEITIATVLTASVLGFLTLFFARANIGTLSLSRLNTPPRRLLGSTFGGIITGALAAPLITVYFGLKSRPDMTPDFLLPGSIVGAAFLIFAIVNFDFERLNAKRMWGGALAAFAALACGFVLAVIVFGILYLVGAVGAVTDYLHDSAYDVGGLLLGGLAYGLPVGLVLGVVIGVALNLTERFTGKPVLQ